MRRAFQWTVLGLSALLGLGGCATHPRAPQPAGDAPIRELHLFSLPVALNLDAEPGADGIGVKLYAIAAGQVKAVPIRAGVLEFIAFDGTVNFARTPRPDPFHVWQFTPADLARHEILTVLGTGYDLVLAWAPKRLSQGRVMIVARYLAVGDGPVVVSAPSSIAASSF